MALNANIFIPDISGYTEFVSRTELDHSSHIINELLKVLVDSNRVDLTLAEVEGDALLFYRSGDAIALEETTRQAIDMFTNFHTCLKIIERDSICQCGACQTASRLTLKFVVHYGTIKEIRISSFVKASGLDMIIAHRLLKNSLQSSEYILATTAYFNALAGKNEGTDLQWKSSSEEYPTVGRISFQYALLDSVRNSIPPVPPRDHAVIHLSERSVEIEIRRPMLEVYQTLIDLDARIRWNDGLRGGKGEPIDRLDSKHYCYFDDATVEIVPLDRDIRDDMIRYSEQFTVVEQNFRGIFDFVLRSTGPHETRLTCRVGGPDGSPLPDDVVEALLSQIRDNAERLKEYCERNEDGQN